MDEKTKRIIKEVLPFVIVIAVVLLFKSFIMTPVQVQGDSMEPTLNEGDILILNKVSYKLHGIKRFSIVVIDNDGTNLIKRVIGLPGETVKVENNKLFIDGKLVEQDFLERKQITEDFEITLEDGYYFVMGDNRNISLDSRSLGPFHKSKIKGTASFVIFPFNRIGGKN